MYQNIGKGSIVAEHHPVDVFEYRYRPQTNQADTIWCKSSNSQDKDLCITMAQNIAKIQEICSTLDNQKRIELPIWQKQTNNVGKQSIKPRIHGLKEWYNKRTELLAKKSSKFHSSASRQSPATVLAGMLQKYGDILEDINVNPNSRKITPSVAQLQQQNNVAESLLEWIHQLINHEDVPGLQVDRFHNNEHDGYRASKIKKIYDLAKSITIDAIDESEPTKHWQNLKLTSTGLFESTV